MRDADQPSRNRRRLASHMRTDLVLDALRMAFHPRGHGANVQFAYHSGAGIRPPGTPQFDDSQASTTTASERRSAPSGMPTTAPLPRASSTASSRLIRDGVWRSRSQLELAIVEFALFNS